jgi:hypothetical protein
LLFWVKQLEFGAQKLQMYGFDTKFDFAEYTVIFCWKFTWNSRVVKPPKISKEYLSIWTNLSWISKLSSRNWTKFTDSRLNLPIVFRANTNCADSNRSSLSKLHITSQFPLAIWLYFHSRFPYNFYRTNFYSQHPFLCFFYN